MRRQLKLDASKWPDTHDFLKDSPAIHSCEGYRWEGEGGQGGGGKRRGGEGRGGKGGGGEGRRGGKVL